VSFRETDCDSLPVGAKVGEKRNVRPQTSKGFLFVVRSDGKHHIVDKNAQISKIVWPM